MVPSEIVAWLDSEFPNLGRDSNFVLGLPYVGFCRALNDALATIDPSLLPDARAQRDLMGCRGILLHCIESWSRDPRNSPDTVDRLSPKDQRKVLWVVWDTLKKCPDRLPPEKLTSLLFVGDESYRNQLRIDLADIEALSRGKQWKAATVMAGSLAEALLCDQVSRVPEAQRESAVKSLIGSGEFDGAPPQDFLRWNLNQYCHVCAHLGLIKKNTKTLLLEAKNFRNLVHPGRQLREGLKCSPGTALAAIAALTRVIEDLEAT